MEHTVLPPFKARQVHGTQRRRKSTHSAVGMSGMPPFMGGQAAHAASCVSTCMSHVVAPASQRAPIVAPVPLCVSHHWPPAGSSYLF